MIITPAMRNLRANKRRQTSSATTSLRYEPKAKILSGRSEIPSNNIDVLDMLLQGKDYFAGTATSKNRRESIRRSGRKSTSLLLLSSVNAFKPNINRDNGVSNGVALKGKMETKYPRKDELFESDKLQFWLINITAFLHCTAIFCALVMFHVGWNSTKWDWNTADERVEACKGVISFCTILAFISTFIVRREQHKELKLPNMTLGLSFEYSLILLHVPPFTSRFMPDSADWLDTFNIILFTRFYILYEVCRVRSSLWRLRRVNFDSRGEQSKVTGFYYVKYSMSNAPLKFFFVSSIVLLLCLAEAMLVFERWVQPDLDRFHCLYYMVIVFTSVGLGDIYCKTRLGRTLTVVAACTGVIFLSICVGFLFEAIELQDKEMEIKDNHTKILAMIEYRNFSAIIIQRWWKKTKGKNVSQSKSVSAMDELLTTDFKEAKSTIREQMMIANKQSAGQLARETHKFVEKLDKNIEEILMRLRRATSSQYGKSSRTHEKLETADTESTESIAEDINTEGHNINRSGKKGDRSKRIFLQRSRSSNAIPHLKTET